MKRFALVFLMLLCVIPLASATVHTWNVSQSNENEGVRTNLVILRSNQVNISSIQSLTIQGCNPYTGHNTAYDKTGSFELKNQTNTTLATGTYSSQYEDTPNPYCPYAGTIWHEYTFSNYSNAYPAIVDTWKMWYSNGIGYYGDGAVSDSEAWKSTFLPRDQSSPIAGGYTFTYISTTEPAPAANFTATPTNATAPAYIPFTDASTGELGTCTYNWSFSPPDGVLAAPQDLDNQDITILFTQDGDFTISHGVSCPAGSDIETKTDYIHITNSTAASTFRVRAVDALSGYGVNGAQVDVFDIENSSWTNQTSVTGEVTVTALTGHTINAYGSATGYDDGESLALPVVASSLYPIYMWPSSFVTNVSEGNVTVYVTVLEDGTNTRLSGYAVSLTGPSSGGADFTSGQTNENGIFQAVIKNQTNYNVKVLAQKGHLGANKNFNSGNQSGGDAYVEVTLWLGVNSITTAPTVTTLPGGGTPTPTITYLANCDPKASDYDAAKCRTSKGGSGLNILADNLEGLIWICLIVTVIYLIKGIGK